MVRLTVTHEDLEPGSDMERKISQGWPRVCSSLKSLLETAISIADMRFFRVSTSRLNEVVRDAVRRHNPTVFKGKVAKIYYATQTQVNPPTFVFFVNDPQAVHFTYERYLENQLRAEFGFKGSGIRMYFRARPKSEQSERH